MTVQSAAVEKSSGDLPAFTDFLESLSGKFTSACRNLLRE
jgi:hypothetical protein